MTKRLSVQELIYSKQQLSTIQNSNSLIVGVGGIGCELLKVLTNSGYRKMTIVDLDSIELSNLNRQFYFRREHVGRSKAEVGRESVLIKNQDLDITAIKGSIFEDRFDVGFFSQFDIVFCALDNIPAREHLGRMCIRSGRVMVDAGTSGFNGQVNVTIRNHSQCNNCQPSAPVTTYAICTIRSSPSEPIHCVSYGMSLYKVLFGPSDTDNDLHGYLTDNVDLTNEEDLQNNSIKLFDNLFYEKIKQGLDDGTSFNKFRYPINYQQASNIDAIYDYQQDQDRLSDSQKIQSVKFYAEQFISSIRDIFESGKVGYLDFEKDDPICIAFITSVVFFRTYNFTHKFKDVNQQFLSNDKFKYLSQHEVKVMGGKVIPAIASTNAIAAAIQCLEANKVQGNDLKSLQYVWITQNANRISITNLGEPTQDCKVCAQNIIYVNMRANFTKHKFQDFLHLIKKFGLEQKAISLTGSADFIYSQNDPYMQEENDEQLYKFLGDIIQEGQQSLSFTIAEDEIMNQNEYWKFGIYYEFFIANYEGDFIFDKKSEEQDILELRRKQIEKQFLYQQAQRKRLYQRFEQY